MPGKRFHRVLLWAVLCVVLAGVAFHIAQTSGWKEIRQGTRREWRKNSVTHIDENGDGVVDEEDVINSKTGKCTVRRDSDFDGYFDLKYNLTSSGVATNISKIHEKVPRH